jgi:putative SOS response-associated peptidase YedK
MCGRFKLTMTPEVMAELFGIDDEPVMAPRFNIAPTQQVLTVRRSDGNRRQWAHARWGLVPSWAKDPSIGARMINARAETVAEKPSFRVAVRKRRCLIPADGFYEWRKTGAGKQPYLIGFEDGQPFAMAGLWESWRQPDGSPLESCTILTTSANPVVADLHERMPVILPPELYDEWLHSEPLPPPRLQEILVPFTGPGMTANRVSTRVNNPRNDDPACAQLIS